MAKVVLLDPLGYGRSLFGHRHFIRDWTGAYVPGYMAFPPLELMYAASYLKKYGHEPKIIEGSIRHLTHRKLVTEIERDHPDFVAIPSTYFSVEDDKYLSSLIRQKFARAKIIFLGPLATYDPSIFLNDNSADFVGLGEYESPILNIIEGRHSENIAYKSDGKIIYGKRGLIDLSELPIPARDLINNQAYQYAIFNRKNPATLMTISRGCPHSKCEFCHSNLYSLGELRYRDICAITQELSEIIFKYKIKEIFFRDQTFTANRELVFRMCEYILSKKINISWRASTRVDLVDKGLLTLMHRAGCYQLSFGLESSSQRSLDIVNKGFTLEQARDAVKLTKDVGIEVLGLFMYGIPGDTASTIHDLFKYALDLGVDYANFNEIFLIPGAPLYDKYIANKAVLIPQTILKKRTARAYLKFYFRPAFLKNHLIKINVIKNFKHSIKTAIDALLFFMHNLLR